MGDQAGRGTNIISGGNNARISNFNGSSISDFGWVRIRSESLGSISSSGSFRSIRGRNYDGRIADVWLDNGLLRIEVIGAGRLRCSFRGPESYMSGEMGEQILEPGENIDLNNNGEYVLNIENLLGI